MIDTRVFQRLRYIRQNALLHFVFPGAVHTRFAHSLGTMAVAGRVFLRLTKPLDLQPENRDLQYIAAVFRLGALLHDVGHCAFSHSSEEVIVRKKTNAGIVSEPLHGTLEDRLATWSQHELVNELRRIDPRTLRSPARHEELGIALIFYLFEKQKVADLCQQTLRADPRDVARDAAALIHGELSTSKTWKVRTKGLHEAYRAAVSDGKITGRVNKKDFASDLQGILHSLISGTLDVDRMDYLLRDSYYCGVPYGRCDIDILIANLSLGGVSGRLDFFLNRKAVDALDDLLWSRYQLFVQVLNHKANVALNKMLSFALSDAISDGHLRRPVSMEDYLLFTDDHVMASIREVCHTAEIEDKPYAKTLVDRNLPLHLGTSDDLKPSQLAAEVRAKARAAKVPPSVVWTAAAESVLIKGGRFPSVLVFDRTKGRFDLHGFEEYSQFRPRRIPARRKVVHFFVDRGLLKSES